jgi:2,3-bisphosphoglycerate-dependent phosphoglycerate mutase
MNRVILVRHAEPQVEIEIPAAAWSLTTRGEQATRRLVPRLASLRPGVVVTSPERKALQTAGLLAEGLELSLQQDERFSEQGAEVGEFFPDYSDFRARVEEHFARPDEVVFRGESSHAAADRFASGVASLRESATTGVPIIVSHGRIMASWLASVTGEPALGIWTSLRMPDLIEVDLDTLRYRSIPVDLVQETL